MAYRYDSSAWLSDAASCGELGRLCGSLTCVQNNQFSNSDGQSTLPYSDVLGRRRRRRDEQRSLKARPASVPPLVVAACQNVQDALAPLLGITTE